MSRFIYDILLHFFDSDPQNCTKNEDCTENTAYRCDEDNICKGA